MSKENKLNLTSIKIHGELRDEFQRITAGTKFSMQKLTNRAVHFFINDIDFRRKMMHYPDLNNSGSGI